MAFNFAEETKIFFVNKSTYDRYTCGAFRILTLLFHFAFLPAIQSIKIFRKQIDTLIDRHELRTKKGNIFIKAKGTLRIKLYIMYNFRV